MLPLQKVVLAAILSSPLSALVSAKRSRFSHHQYLQGELRFGLHLAVLKLAPKLSTYPRTCKVYVGCMEMLA